MRMERSSFPTRELLLLGPIPALVALAVALAVEAIPLATIVAVATIAYGVLIAGATEARKDARRGLQMAPEYRPALELMNTIPLATATATIGVARTTGICPLGFGRGSAWTLYQDGRLTYPLCRPAVQALSPALQGGMAKADGVEIACQCPLADREVVFTIAADGWQQRSVPASASPTQAPSPEHRRAA